MRRGDFRRFSQRWFAPLGRQPQARLDVFLLMGQSNMAGFGCVREDDPWQPGDFAPRPGIWAMGGQGRETSARPCGWLRWRPAAHPLHLNQRSAAFGLGLPFAEALRAADPQREIGLVPCAWGGAGIDAMMPGTPVFRNAVRRGRIASETGAIRGVLWHQGETDAGSTELAAAHEGKLRELMAALRNELGDLVFLIGDLAPFTGERTGPVRDGLKRVAESDPQARWVPGDGLSGVDAVHFGRESLVEFGRRYAAAWVG
jgi:hypothetical protein